MKIKNTTTALKATIAICATTLIIFGLSTCYKTSYTSKYRSSLEHCRVNKVTVIDDYQNGHSPYPTRNRWILQTDEGYKVISYNGNYRVGDSITIEVRQY
jgi:hypothetical protein